MASVWTVRRSATDHKVSGLSGGIGRLWNVDPVLIRVGFVLLTFAGGIGLVLYVAGWLMVPLEGRDRSRLDDLLPQTRHWSRELRIGIVAVICLLCIGASSWVVPFGLAAAAVLAAVWYFGYYKHRTPRPLAADKDGHQSAAAQPGEEPQFFDYAGPPTPFTQAARVWQERIIAERRARTAGGDPAATDIWHAAPVDMPRSAVTPDSEPQPGTYPPAGPGPDPYRAAFLSDPDPVGLYPPPDDSDGVSPRAARRLRRRPARRLGLVTLVVLGLVLTGLGMASAAGMAVSVSGYLAACLLVLGIALLAGTTYGRPPGAALAAVLVALAMITSLVVARPAVAGKSLGIRTVDYSAASVMPTHDRLSLGQLTVNLSDLTLHQDRTYRARVDTGQLRVMLPKHVRTSVHAKVGHGQLRMRGQTQSGSSDVREHFTVEPASAHPGQHQPRLTLVLRVDRGQLEVTR
jgi:phage shock protein PspC (stress-responsive transcriptional regulator)